MLCTSLGYFVTYPGSVASELVSKMPTSRLYNQPRINLFPFTTSVTLRYHDLAAENRAAVAAASGDEPLPCPVDSVRIFIDSNNQITVDGVNVASDKLSMHLRNLIPSPKRACYALASSPTGPLVGAIAALTDIGILKLPLAVDCCA
jgi:hypothetical protein